MNEREKRARKEKENQNEDLADANGAVVLDFKAITCLVETAAQVDAHQSKLEFEEVWRE